MSVGEVKGFAVILWPFERSDATCLVFADTACCGFLSRSFILNSVAGEARFIAREMGSGVGSTWWLLPAGSMHPGI